MLRTAPILWTAMTNSIRQTRNDYERETMVDHRARIHLALVFGLEQFRSYIQGDPVECKTDHKALAWLLTKD